MYVARSHADFNESFNLIAGTDNIQYATPWEMSTRTGRAFMLKNNTQVGRLFASHALAGTVGNSRLLATTHLTPMQKATLSALALSSSDQQYNAALLSAIRHGALKNVAARVLGKPNADDYVPQQTPILQDMEMNESSVRNSDADAALPDVASSASNLEADAALPDVANNDAPPAATLAQNDTEASAPEDVNMKEAAPTAETEVQLTSKTSANLLQAREMNGGNALVAPRKRKKQK